MAEAVSSSQSVEEPELSLEEFTALPGEEGYRLELSRGRLVREPAPGLRHGDVAGRIYRILWSWAEKSQEGRAFIDVGFALSTDPPTVRVPDVAFLRSERIPEEGLPDRFGDGAPDLAVEVLSPSNSASEMQGTSLDYLDGGAALVWVVDPSQRSVTVYRSPGDIRILRDGDLLEGGEVLPGFRIPVGDLFEST